jgi:hypothetical protein
MFARISVSESCRVSSYLHLFLCKYTAVVLTHLIYYLRRFFSNSFSTLISTSQCMRYKKNKSTKNPDDGDNKIIEWHSLINKPQNWLYVTCWVCERCCWKSSYVRGVRPCRLVKNCRRFGAVYFMFYHFRKSARPRKWRHDASSKRR